MTGRTARCRHGREREGKPFARYDRQYRGGRWRAELAMERGPARRVWRVVVDYPRSPAIHAERLRGRMVIRSRKRGRNIDIPAMASLSAWSGVPTARRASSCPNWRLASSATASVMRRARARWYRFACARTMPGFFISRATCDARNVATTAGSNPSNASRKASRFLETHDPAGRPGCRASKALEGAGYRTSDAFIFVAIRAAHQWSFSPRTSFWHWRLCQFCSQNS